MLEAFVGYDSTLSGIRWTEVITLIVYCSHQMLVTGAFQDVFSVHLAFCPGPYFIFANISALQNTVLCGSVSLLFFSLVNQV